MVYSRLANIPLTCKLKPIPTIKDYFESQLQSIEAS